MGLLLCDGAAVASAGCAGIWQLCDEVRTVGCRSRFVLLAQQANSSHAIAGRATRTMWSAAGAYPTRPGELASALGARTNDGIFITLWKLAAWPWQHKTPSLPHRCGK